MLLFNTAGHVEPTAAACLRLPLLATIATAVASDTTKTALACLGCFDTASTLALSASGSGLAAASSQTVSDPVSAPASAPVSAPVSAPLSAPLSAPMLPAALWQSTIAAAAPVLTAAVLHVAAVARPGARLADAIVDLASPARTIGAPEPVPALHTLLLLCASHCTAVALSPLLALLRCAPSLALLAWPWLVNQLCAPAGLPSDYVLAVLDAIPAAAVDAPAAAAAGQLVDTLLHGTQTAAVGLRLLQQLAEEHPRFRPRLHQHLLQPAAPTASTLDQRCARMGILMEVSYP